MTLCSLAIVVVATARKARANSGRGGHALVREGERRHTRHEIAILRSPVLPMAINDDRNLK